MYVSSNYFLAEFFSRLLIYFADVCAAQVFSIQILDILRSTRHSGSSAAVWCWCCYYRVIMRRFMLVISEERARCNNNNDDVNLDTEYL